MGAEILSLRDRWTIGRRVQGQVEVLYRPTEKGALFHAEQTPNAILEGPRGTGKSMILRNDAHIHAMSCPGLSYLIVRRTIPELKKSHLQFIEREMAWFGGRFNKQANIAYYPNGSLGFFGHCREEKDVLIYLSSQFARLYIDEITTFPGDMVLKLASTVRVSKESGWQAAMRGGTNPLGESADWVKRWFIDKTVDPEESDEYRPDDYTAVRMRAEDNPHMDWAQYRRRLANLPEYVRKAWLEGEWIIEGIFFADFKPRKDGQPWHVLDEMPNFRSQPLDDAAYTPGLAIYRSVDYGFEPDPAICLWIAVLPSGRAVVIKERSWWRTTAVEVAKAIIRESTGMRIIETLCDPSVFRESKATGSSIGDLMEQQGLPMTPSVNDRVAAGYAIHEWMGTLLDDGKPKLQIVRHGAPQLIKTIPEMRQDPHDPQRIRDSNDHYVMALAYFCMRNASPSVELADPIKRAWMRSHRMTRIGSTNIRESYQ